MPPVPASIPNSQCESASSLHVCLTLLKQSFGVVYMYLTVKGGYFNQLASNNLQMPCPEGEQTSCGPPSLYCPHLGPNHKNCSGNNLDMQ